MSYCALKVLGGTIFFLFIFCELLDSECKHSYLFTDLGHQLLRHLYTAPLLLDYCLFLVMFELSFTSGNESLGIELELG